MGLQILHFAGWVSRTDGLPHQIFAVLPALARKMNQRFPSQSRLPASKRSGRLFAVSYVLNVPLFLAGLRSPVHISQ